MPPFLQPKLLVSGIKEKAGSLVVQGDRLYIGTSLGNLHIYGLKEKQDDGAESIQLVETKKNLTRRSIEQLGFIKDINSLVLLSESLVTLFPLPSFSPPTPLIKAKAAFSFAIHTSVQHILPESKDAHPTDADFSKPKSIPTLVTVLMVGCRRKVVIYSWKDGEPQEVKEAPLPHSPRAIAFLGPDTACFAYPTDYAMFSIPAMTAVDFTTPLPVTASTTAMGALSGLTGYMTLGLGAKAKPSLLQVSDSEALIIKDNEGLFIGPDTKPARPSNIEWPVPPDEIAFVKPYIFSVLPAGTVPAHPIDACIPSASQPAPSFIPTTVVQIRSSISLQTSQIIPFPFDTPDSGSRPVSPTSILNASVRLLTASPSAKSPLFLVTTPIDRTAAAVEGSSIWEFTMKSWVEQIDELVVMGQYADALALLDTIEEAVLPDKEQRRTRIRALNAVSQFRASQFDAAIDTFIDLDFNPAKVVALYPESVAGRLSVPPEGWIPLYGGPAPLPVDDTSSVMLGENATESEKGSTFNDRSATDLLDTITTGAGSIRGRLRGTGLGMLLPGGAKDDDTASISSKRKFVLHDDLHRSVETLVRYLANYRPKLDGALRAVNITPQNQSHTISPLSQASIEELFALPNSPLSALTPEQLLRFAQIVDTALYKSYLIIRPALLGSLCRVPNWCEVSEVEEDLRARGKFAEMRDLYNGKKMHAKALQLLRDLSEKETDMEDKLEPSISYLRKLGPEYIDQIFDSSKWIIEQDRDMAFQIFTSEDVELPRQAVANYLENIDPMLCARYLEYVIEEGNEDSPAFHDRLADIYFSMTLAAKKRNDEKSRKEVYGKLLKFIDTNDRFGVDRLYGRLSSTELYEARAILLGRLGRHDQALELYVYKLQDYLKAEEYCKRVYQPGTDTSSVFLTLLRIYLRPTVKTTADLLQPALDLIHRHNPRLDAVETLQLLPPLVTAEDVRAFLIEALRAPIFDTRVVRNISKARNDQLSRRLIALQSKRVKVTDSRICPQCHKRLGNSVIAVHAPRGEVTHYQCRELFSRRLNETRH
ncbi:hypothetical protein BDQ12DRAFT_634973 [Crucibulum laeve]|uniref:CNH domain-containing protein n=1 Tax=Crucibulum laeve TaxID=68775 RepID=A0A5C3LT35_9AGAR|nr:hypothetical protein BDQ12DRAFT_634973 [Crucibulum laeve]